MIVIKNYIYAVKDKYRQHESRKTYYKQFTGTLVVGDNIP